MNRHILYIILSLLLVGCSDTFDESNGLIPTMEPHYLSVSKQTLSFNAQSNQKETLTVTSIQTPWKFINDSKWLTLSVEQEIVMGEKTTDVDVFPLENKSADTTRTHIIFLESSTDKWKSSTPIIISQSKAVPYIVPQEQHFTLSGRKQVVTVKIESNTDWSCASTQSWIKAIRQGDMLFINVEDNNTLSARNGEIALSGATITAISIEQEPANLTAVTDTIIFDRTAGTYTLAVESDLQWQAYTNDSWIQVSPEMGDAGENKIEISVTHNNSTSGRKGYVYVKIANKSVKIPVWQQGYYTKADNQDIVFDSHGGAMIVSVSSNDNWKATIDDNDWLVLSETYGSGAKELTLIAKENATLNSRSVPMLISSDHSDDIKLNIMQNPRYLTSSSSSIAFFGKGGTETIHISTDGEYRIEKTGDWFTVSQNGDDILVSVSENDTRVWRNGSITMTLTDLKEGEMKMIIPIEQAFNSKTIDKSNYDSDAEWNDDKSDWQVKISVIGYRNDNDWSVNSDKTVSYIGMGEYESDKEIVISTTPIIMKHLLYNSDDKDWNIENVYSSLHYSDYAEDNEVSNNDKNSEIMHSYHSDDRDWSDNKNNGSAKVDISDYSNDEDWTNKQ